MSKKVFLTSIIVLFIFIIVVIFGYFLMSIKSKHNLKIPSSNRGEVITYLQKQGVNVGFLDELFLSLTPKPIKGWIYLSEKEQPRYKFLYQLSKRAIHYTPVTIVPGETTTNVLDIMAKKLHLSRVKLEKSYERIAPYKEGSFLADTYNIPIFYDANETISYLIGSSLKRFKSLSKEYYSDFNLTSWKRVIIIASIIQKEAANIKEMPIVASVIFNRLNKHMRLQMDGTLNYGIYSHKKVTPWRIKNDKTSYNTYKHKGLPKEPVCNVSVDAIKAAINPAKTEYLYFMRNSNGVHDFTKTYKKHLKNVHKRREEQKTLEKMQ